MPHTKAHANNSAFLPPQRVFIDTLPPATLVLASSTPLALTQLQSQLTHCSHLRLLASSNKLTQTIPLVMLHRPDILLLAYHKPAEPLLPLLASLKKTLNGLAIILCLLSPPDPSDLPTPLKNLCEGILAPPYTSKQLTRAIELISCGYTVHTTSNHTTAINGHSTVQTITDRDHEILRLLCLGLGNADIARHLFLAESTIKSHTSRLKNKLNAHNRTALAVAAIRYGLV